MLLVPGPSGCLLLLRLFLLLQMFVLRQPAAGGEELVLGYLTGSQRLPGDLEYSRPGLVISGAISLAVNDMNRLLLRGTGHSLRFIVAETYGDETHSIRQTAELWTANVTGYIGPQETCVHEAKMAAAFNLPMISYFCTYYETSDKEGYPTFARTRPPDTQISKSVASLLLHFNWTRVTFFYLNSTETDMTPVAETILDVLSSAGVSVPHIRTWSQGYHHGYMENPFRGLVEETYQTSRIYLILGQYYEHLGLLVALEERHLFDKGEYWVVGVDLDQYDPEIPGRYLQGLLQEQAFLSYLGLSPYLCLQSIPLSCLGRCWVVGVDLDQYDPVMPGRYLQGLLQDQAFLSSLGLSPYLGLQSIPLSCLGRCWVVGVDLDQYDPEMPGRYLQGLLQEQAFLSYLGLSPYLCLQSIPLSCLGEYWVVGVDLDQYDPEMPGRYLQGLLQEQAFLSSLGLSPYLCLQSIPLSCLGEYWVVGVDLDQYDPEMPGRYLQGLLQEQAFLSSLGLSPYLCLQSIPLSCLGEYWVVGVDLDQYDPEMPGRYLQGLLQDEPDPAALKAFRSYLGLSPSPARGLENFTAAVNKLLEEPPFSFPNPVRTVGGAKTIRPEAAYLYDAVKLYTEAALEVLSSPDGDLRNGSHLIERLRGRHYSSAMGYEGYMDQNGDAEGNYTLLARNSGPDGRIGLFPVGVFTYSGQATRALPELQLTSEIDWGLSGGPPIPEPPCGFAGEKCVSHTMEIAGGVAGATAALVLLGLLVAYRNLRYEQELDSLLWKIDYRELEIEDRAESASLHDTKNKVGHPLMRTSQVSLSSNPDFDFRYSSIYTTVGKYKGRVFAVKRVEKKSIDITRKMKKELKIMRDLRHDNINPFIGACTESPNICIVTEYCHRGSLKDILENEDVKLDGMFKASLVGDIIQGLNFLHDSALKVHGNLKTSNCLVDSRWVVKLCDFGLTEFKNGSDFNNLWSLKHFCSDMNICLCTGLLYKAPELLRCDPSHSVGTQKGDIYSFGIILYEIHSRKGPFGESTGLSPRQILQRLIHPNSSLPFRPPLEGLDSDSLDCVRDILRDCWLEEPESRPDIRAVRTRLRPMRKGMKANIFDNMIALMEKYSTNLEALVDERTDQLVEEKKKTDALLYEMLPKYVAEQLKRGHKVEAESFDCVTIYFSDIVGFTSMSAESTPLQVVDFLNDLYTCFDSIIEAYDVYKVETIGDAYMVCSGCPVRNGDQHAAEIATMALDILTAVEKFKIKHRPNDKLKIRIGIHSGTVCAGVVGQKMPRYCLFGDTVNTASRMESNGIAGKIHCSEQTKKLLEGLGGYSLEERGLVELKGKGEQKTYFLVWEEAVYREQRRGVRRGCLLRSSLKTKLSRASSFDSPKRLRFASNHTGGNGGGEPGRLEVIADSPVKRKTLEVGVCEDLSASCPCFEKPELRRSGGGLRVPSSSVVGESKTTNFDGAISDPALFLPDQINTPLLSISQVV